MNLLGYEDDKARELMMRYPYFMGFWQGRDIENLKMADPFDLLEGLEEFQQAGMDRAFSNFLCDAQLISEELLKYALDYSIVRDYSKFVSCYDGKLTMDLIIDMLMANVDYDIVSMAVKKVDKVKNITKLIDAASWGLSTPDVIFLIDRLDGKADKSQIEDLIDISGEEIYPYLSSFVTKLSEKDQGELNEKYY